MPTVLRRLRRNSDPVHSHEAAASLSVEGLNAATEEVVKYLRENAHRWVPAAELHASPVGGQQWDRRLREARRQGVPVDNRRIDGSRHWEWRWLG